VAQAGEGPALSLPRIRASVDLLLGSPRADATRLTPRHRISVCVLDTKHLFQRVRIFISSRRPSS
jgi:hypothetical protein